MPVHSQAIDQTPKIDSGNLETATQKLLLRLGCNSETLEIVNISISRLKPYSGSQHSIIFEGPHPIRRSLPSELRACIETKDDVDQLLSRLEQLAQEIKGRLETAAKQTRARVGAQQ